MTTPPTGPLRHQGVVVLDVRFVVCRTIAVYEPARSVGAGSIKETARLRSQITANDQIDLLGPLPRGGMGLVSVHYGLSGCVAGKPPRLQAWNEWPMLIITIQERRMTDVFNHRRPSTRTE